MVLTPGADGGIPPLVVVLDWYDLNGKGGTADGIFEGIGDGNGLDELTGMMSISITRQYYEYSAIHSYILILPAEDVAIEDDDIGAAVVVAVDVVAVDVVAAVIGAGDPSTKSFNVDEDNTLYIEVIPHFEFTESTLLLPSETC